MQYDWAYIADIILWLAWLSVYLYFAYIHIVVEVWSVSNVSVQDLNVDKKETNNASVFISEDLLRQQENGEYV